MEKGSRHAGAGRAAARLALRADAVHPSGPSVARAGYSAAGGCAPAMVGLRGNLRGPTSLAGDGPRAEPYAREGIDLREMSMVTRPVAVRRQRLLKRLHVWLVGRGLSLTALWIGKVEYADALLSDCGQYCFEEGHSMHDCSESSTRSWLGGRSGAAPQPKRGAWRALGARSCRCSPTVPCGCRSCWPCRR